MSYDDEQSTDELAGSPSEDALAEIGDDLDPEEAEAPSGFDDFGGSEEDL